MGKLSQDIIEQIPILYEKLKTKTAVAKELGISVTSVTKYLLQENSIPGAKERKKAVKITPEMEEQINQRYQECGNMAQVARELNVSVAAVRNHLSEESKEKSKKLYDDRDALFFYIYRKFGAEDEENPVSEWNLIQMNKFREQGMPYRGQLLTLKYYYDIKHHKVKDEYKTIGIIPYIWAEAAAYYKKQEKLQEQISKEIEEQLARDRVEISFKPSDYMKKNRRKKKKIDIKNWEVENE